MLGASRSMVGRLRCARSSDAKTHLTGNLRRLEPRANEQHHLALAWIMDKTMGVGSLGLHACGALVTQHLCCGNDMPANGSITLLPGSTHAAVAHRVAAQQVR